MEISSLWILLDWIYALTIIFVIALIILENRSPEKTVSWIVIIVLVPVIGVVFYIFFGQVYRKKKIFSRKGLKSSERLRILKGQQLKTIRKDKTVQNDSAPEMSNGIAKMLLKNSESVVTLNNVVDVINDGEKTFRTIIENLRKAQHHIHLEFYIFLDDKLGSAIIDELCKKALSGVKVRVLFDDVGSWELKKKSIQKMQNSGIEIHSFQKVRFPYLSSKVNYRNHRKLIVVDGKVGFTGGFNIADRYVEGDPELGYWRDTFIKIEGEAVWSLQNIFAADWFFTTRLNISHPEYYPQSLPVGNVAVQVVSSGPDSDWPAISQFYFAAISQARKQVLITSPYFMPPDDIVSALKTTALRGVDVQIIIPKRSDSVFTNLASESYIEEMLEAGVRIYRYSDGFIHSKTIVVDREIVSIGSANMDFRSLDTNFEVSAIVYNSELALAMDQVFRTDIKHCESISTKSWKKRSLARRFITSAARLLSPLL